MEMEETIHFPENNIENVKFSENNNQRTNNKELTLKNVVKPKLDKKYASKYKYGNYDRYYGYRNASAENFKDIRLDAFKEHPQLFAGKVCLDIGCNNGFVTMAIAKNLQAEFITGIDVDKSLINRARQSLGNEKRLGGAEQIDAYPNNVAFKHGNYVLGNEQMLQLEQPQFDTILLLSVSKWIQLNHGDDGIKLVFKRIFAQLKPGGHFILEAQDWKSYKRRKKLTPEIFTNFTNIKLLPQQFQSFLLSKDVGFKDWFPITLADTNAAVGFKRPIQVYIKGEE